ncbi:cytochrome c3 family protein [Sutterella sp.]|uniref:cytochrome c3 family protein n=1 Tax=Sutterella sp. TaxID=1981025 RepID=UPI0026E106AB|nr:cytochrome c3 family protein [Sutterella sp.]MDO5532311.1 cytochrome c3 family protein [Sutterella sp.]
MKHLALILASALLFSTAAVQAADFGADRHVARGLECKTCHGADMKSPEFPDQEVCLQCHKRENVAERTKALNPNPHTAPHNNDCVLCHYQHEPEDNYCAQCHKFDFKMKH